ncbi:MAG: hypothetical protein AAB439_00590 [Patescibacteria group bacterium]
MKQPKGGAGTDLLFFIFFLVVLGIVWALTGGPDRAISRSGPFLNPPFPLGNETGYSLTDFGIPGVTIPESSESNLTDRDRDAENSLDSIIKRIRSGFGEINESTSPYANDVSLSIGRARDTDPEGEYVTIKIGKNISDRLVVSSWRLDSTVSTLGVTLGNAAYLPYSGQVNVESPVAVSPGSTIYVVTGRSPIGTSFRTNVCTGYFAQFQAFEPDLEEACPAPEDVLADTITASFVPSEACISFVENIPRCRSTLSEIPQNIGGQCRNFILEDLTYSACVAAYKNETNFYDNEWRIYLDRDQELWKNTRERIRLLDENGLVIDSVDY